jgi:hypothetical protein
MDFFKKLFGNKKYSKLLDSKKGTEEEQYPELNKAIENCRKMKKKLAEVPAIRKKSKKLPKRKLQPAAKILK